MYSKVVKGFTNVVYIIIGMFVMFAGSYIVKYEKDVKSEGIKDSIIVFVNNPPYELALVEDDLKTYNHLSDNARQEILDSLYGAYKRFKVPIGLMHAVTRTESEYRFWLTHPDVNVKINGKRVKTNALGMGGVIWEIWGDTLKYFDVAHNKSDLYIPGVGITAQACVLHLIIEEVMVDSVPVYNIVPRVQAKYYGAYAKEYIARMKLVISDLWLKRIAKEIDYVYNIEEPVVKDTLVEVYEGYKHKPRKKNNGGKKEN